MNRTAGIFLLLKLWFDQLLLGKSDLGPLAFGRRSLPSAGANFGYEDDVISVVVGSSQCNCQNTGYSVPPAIRT